MNKFIRYFDINSKLRSKLPKGVAVVGGSTKIHWIPQWITLLLGILIQPYLTSYSLTGHWNFSSFWGWLPFSIIVAIVIFPSIYRNVFDENKPLLVLLAPIFTSGLGWNAIFSGLVKLVGV